MDEAGNQLPYIDRIRLTKGEDLEVINLRAIAGEYDLQERHIDLTKLPVLLENQEKGDYTVHLDTSSMGGEAYICVNASYTADPELGKLLANADFRRALSLGHQSRRHQRGAFPRPRHAGLDRAGRRRRSSARDPTASGAPSGRPTTSTRPMRCSTSSA